ncbi:low-density lipoprotein receptor-related protein 6-like [Apostichopus japonicus]|uniref:low-density lipoprotein receptor-related protein 6-like n=1 Tax=Stichopus japonicus TaxID=307972 RepID=UPI003AB663EA
MFTWIFVTAAVVFTLQCYGVADGNLVEARQHELCSYQLDDSSNNGFLENTPPDCFLRNLTFAAAVTVDVRDKFLFFSDVGDRVTYKIDLQITPPKREQILYGWGSIEGIAVDWMARNIFWTDTILQHVAVSRYDGSHRHIIISEDIVKPRGIAVYPAKGYLFWSDISSSSRIERIDMTGQNRVILINYSLAKPNGLTVDQNFERLYFVDGDNDNVEFVDFNGLGRTLVHHENRGDFFGVAVRGTFLFTSSFTSGVQVGVLSSVSDPQDEESANFMYRVLTHSGYGFGLTVNDVSEQPGTVGACGLFNGGCEQLCLPIDTSTYRCACGTGFSLNTDQRTCGSVLLVDPFILVGDSSLNRVIQIDAHESYSSYSALPLQDTMNPTGLAYDPREDKIYWTDGALDQVSRSNLDGTEQEVIAFNNIEEPSGIAIDPVRRKIFWTDEQKNYIERANLDGSRREGYVTTGLDKPRGVAVNTINGDLFWTDWGSEPKIERISDERQNRITLVNDRLYRPNGLAIDPQANLLYWCDANGESSRIEVVSLDGFNRRILTNLSSTSHPFGLAINGDLLFYTDWNMNALLAIERFERSPRALHFGPKIFMRMHGIASSYFIEPDSGGAGVTIVPSAAGSSGSEDDSSSLEVPIIIIAGGAAFLLVFICFVIAIIFVKQKAKTKTRSRSQRLSRQPNIPIPPTPIQNSAPLPGAVALPSKTVDILQDTPDPFTGEHVYMDLDQLTAFHQKGAPPPYSPRRPNKDPAFFDNPSMRRRSSADQDDPPVDHSYYQDGINAGSPNPRPESFHDTYYIDPNTDSDKAVYEDSMPQLRPDLHEYPPTDYMDLTGQATNDVPRNIQEDQRRKAKYSIPSEYIKLKSGPHGSVGNDGDVGEVGARGPYMDLNVQTSNALHPSEDQYMDPLSSRESRRLRLENERSQIEANLRRSGYNSSRSHNRYEN